MTPQVPEIGPAEALRLAEAGEVLLLDVREQHEWDAGHARAAVHLPLRTLPQDPPPRDRPVVAVCHYGGRSGMAAQALADAGYDVRNLAGGMDAWERAGLEVVDSAGGPGSVVG
jgi:rhodanese-related sulfurtransferase